MNDQEAQCRTHEILRAAKARGDTKPALAACVCAMRDSFGDIVGVAHVALENDISPLKKILLLVRIEESMEFFAEALGRLLKQVGEDPNAMLPVLQQIEAAYKADMADVKAGRISLDDLNKSV